MIPRRLRILPCSAQPADHAAGVGGLGCLGFGGLQRTSSRGEGRARRIRLRAGPRETSCRRLPGGGAVKRGAAVIEMAGKGSAAGRQGRQCGSAGDCSGLAAATRLTDLAFASNSRGHPQWVPTPGCPRSSRVTACRLLSRGPARMGASRRMRLSRSGTSARARSTEGSKWPRTPGSEALNTGHFAAPLESHRLCLAVFTPVTPDRDRVVGRHPQRTIGELFERPGNAAWPLKADEGHEPVLRPLRRTAVLGVAEGDAPDEHMALAPRTGRGATGRSAPVATRSMRHGVKACRSSA